MKNTNTHITVMMLGAFSVSKMSARGIPGALEALFSTARGDVKPVVFHGLYGAEMRFGGIRGEGWIPAKMTHMPLSMSVFQIWI